MRRDQRARFDGLSSTVSLLVAYLLPISTADAPLTSTGVTSTNTPQISIMTTPFSPLVTASLLSSVSNSTTSTLTPSDTNQPDQNLFSDDSPEDQNQDNNNVINYYFLLLGIIILLIMAFVWWMHRRRNQRKEAIQQRVQQALARDMEGWINTRRWFHGTWHNQTSASVRREEGLDERGETPPPYRPGTQGTQTHDAVSGLTVLLRTLSGLPPEYRESVGHAGTVAMEPGPVDRAMLPNSATVPFVSST